MEFYSWMPMKKHQIRQFSKLFHKSFPILYVSFGKNYLHLKVYEFKMSLLTIFTKMKKLLILYSHIHWSVKIPDSWPSGLHYYSVRISGLHRSPVLSTPPIRNITKSDSITHSGFATGFPFTINNFIIIRART